MTNIVVLISGRGSNLEALLHEAREKSWAAALGISFVAVISNRPDAAGLAVAARAGVPSAVVDDRRFASRAAFDDALAAEIDAQRPAFVVLAGFMRVLGPAFVRHFAGRLINIHPSLLPAFPGLRTHEQALAAGVRIHGATVHFVAEQVDSGGIIAQAAVPVRPDDDVAALAARVLDQEHRLLPRALRLVVEGRVRFDAGRVVVRDAASGELALMTA